MIRHILDFKTLVPCLLAAVLTTSGAAASSHFAQEVYTARTAIVFFSSYGKIEHDSKKIRVQRLIEEAIRENGRLTLVEDAAKADLVFVAYEKTWFEQVHRSTVSHRVVDIFVFKGGALANWNSMPLEVLDNSENLLRSAGSTVRKFLKEINETAPPAPSAAPPAPPK